MAEEIDKKGVIKAMFFAILIAFLGLGILGWQYRQLEKEKIPALEEKIEEIEAKRVLSEFMGLRIGVNEAGAVKYLTEKAILQKDGGEFELINDFQNYEILNIERLDEKQFRFAVKTGDFVEIIILTKIMDKYYIDSVQLAG